MLPELRHIRALLQVAQTRNFTRAADALNLSQSALTVQIQQLEESLGFRVFDRSKRGVTLTTAGEEIIAPLQQLLSDAENIMKGAHDIAEVRNGSVTVAALPTVASGFLPGVLAEFSRAHAGIRVSILDVVAEHVRDAVLKRQADFGIGTARGPHEELTTLPLFRDRLVLFVPLGHPLSSGKAIQLREAAANDLILPTRNSSVRDLVEAIAHREQVAVRPRHETNFMPTALALVRSGAGVAILPESAVPVDSSELVRVPFASDAFSRQIVLLTRADRTPSPAAAAFLGHLHRHFSPVHRARAQQRSRPSLRDQKK